MYELMILTFLMRWPTHGYQIARIINDVIGPYAKVSNGRLYPLLAKLEDDGLIEPVEDQSEGARRDRRQRAYRLTEAGRKRFHQVMMDTTSNPGGYRELFWLKVPYLDYLEPAERLYLIDHYLNFCQTHIFHLTSEIEDLRQQVARGHFMTPQQLDATIFGMEHFRSNWQLEWEHARAWRERVVAALEEIGDAAAPGSAVETQNGKGSDQ